MTRRAILLAIPYLIFAAAILPYPGLWHRIVGYQSTNNAPLWAAINPANINGQIGWRTLFIGAMLVCGLVYRGRKPLESFCCYCIVLVALSPALANHYLTIPIIALACDWRRKGE